MFFRCTRCKTKLNIYEFRCNISDYYQGQVSHENKRPSTIQGTVAEWLQPLQVQIARNDYSKRSLETIRHLLLSEVGSKPAKDAFFHSLSNQEPRHELINEVLDTKTNSTSTNSTVLHLPTPQHP